jgi:hypothetical protein
LPAHRVLLHDFDDFIARLEREGAEDVVAVTSLEPNRVIIVTRKRYSPRFETRRTGV